MRDWYVFDEGIEKGPFTEQAVVEYLRHRDPAGVYAWCSGFDTWLLVRDVPDLMHALRSSPPLEARGASQSDHAADRSREEAPRAAKKRKGKWAKVGALTGFLLSSASLVAGRVDSNSHRPDAESAAYLLGFIGGGVLLGAFVGVVSGVIGDVLRKTPKQVCDDHDEISNVITAPRYNNFIARHWRGEFPLWLSYWVFGIAGNILAGLIPVLAIASFNSDAGYYPPAVFATVTVTWTGVVTVLIWQLVGIWRSARVYKAERKGTGRTTFWGALAQFVVIIGVFGLVSAAGGQGLPQIAEAYRIAFQNDPDIQPYSIRVMRDGTEVEIVGGIKYGLTRDFATILKASRKIKVVHLDSNGGRLGEGEKLFKLIRRHGLNTYVSSKCLSACALAFAGGRQRYLLEGASLGFHKGALAGAQEREIDSVQRAVFKAAGFHDKFIDRALSTPHEDMWTPSADVLQAANVVTAVTNGKKFAVSGLGANTERDQISSALAKVSPVFDAIRLRFPSQYDEIINEFYDGMQSGKSRSETILSIRAKLAPFIQSLIPLADDDVLQKYVDLVIDQYVELHAKDPAICYRYGSGQDNGADAVSNLSTEILLQEGKIQASIVTTAVKRADADKELIVSLWKKIWGQLASEGFTQADVDLISSTNVNKTDHPRYCNAMIDFYRTIARLPIRETALLMREIMAAPE